jgi:Ran GTPase-activating protein (RanGAP) involved in mRNA processing and transport
MLDNDLIPLGDALIKNRTLGCLKLGEGKFSSPLSKPVTDVLHWTNSLIDVDVSSSALDEEATQQLSEILPKNNNL